MWESLVAFFAGLFFVSLADGCFHGLRDIVLSFRVKDPDAILREDIQRGSFDDPDSE